MYQQLPATLPLPRSHPAPPTRAGVVRANRLLRFVCALFLLTMAVGSAWDGYWHVTRAFDGFWSPPHLFIYAMTTLLGALVAAMVCARPIRAPFGPGLRVPGLPVAVPGALLILAGGFALLPLAGLLDSAWHTAFGLDETGWSTPHALIGWSLLVIVLGLVACRLALHPQRPATARTAVVLGLLLLTFSAVPLLGPLYANNTPDTVRAVAAIPVLAAQPEPQHTFRIYLNWNLTRANPLFIPLGALWAGAALAAVRALDPRKRAFLTTIAVWSALGLLGGRGDARRLDRFVGSDLLADPAAWLPAPLLAAALVLTVLLRLGLAERGAWAIAGLIFALPTALTWGDSPLAALLIPLAAPAAVLGAALGRRLHACLYQPRLGNIRALLLIAFGVPCATGLLDLTLRMVTP